MAKEIAKLLRTEMAADVTALPMLAKLLQQYGRKGDKVLAHITPEEAQRLEDEGGSGTINPHTGLPEYYEEGDFGVYDSGGQEMAPQDVAQAYPEYYPGGQLPEAGQDTTFNPPDPAALGFARDAEYTPRVESAPVARATRGLSAPVAAPYSTAELRNMAPADPYGAPAPTPAPQEKGFFEGITNMTPQEKRNLLLRSGLGISSGLMAGYQGRKAAQQAEKARKDTEAIGKPYQEQGRQLQAQALRGELTPAGQQQLQTAQAQLAQGAERRGGVGAQQAATQIQAFRQNLLDQQYNYGLKVAQIGDSYAANAIKVGLTQDAGVSSSMKAYTAALAAMYGMQPNVQG
jgi:hypothetical protein